MKKQELIEKFKARRTIIGNFQGYAVYWEDIKEIFEQLDEPEKVKIPQMVAEWIDYCKENHLTITGAFDPVSEHGIGLAGTFKGKVYKCTRWALDNQNLFARAWLDGYEVEKEKRYKVVMPNVSSTGGVWTRIKHDDSWIWIDTLGTIVEGRTHTRKELEEAGFSWVFDCPGIKVEEVDD
nr:MAG TPA: Protein of unknown function (DUF1642) [Caudoviricetes sp.]